MLAALCSPRRSFQQGCRACLGFFCRVLCRVGCRVADSLRLVEALSLFERLGHTVLAMLVEAMPFFQRFGHTVLAMLRDLAATLYTVQGVFFKVSEWVLLAWEGVREHSALGGVRVGSAGVGHAEIGAREGRGAACDLLE